MQDSDLAVWRVKGHKKFPPDATLVAGQVNGGCALILTLGQKQEVFIHSTYALAAGELETWLETREEKVSIKKGNRRHRRAIEALNRKKGAPN